MPTTEAGHAPNRIYTDQEGNLHLNGGTLYVDESGTSFSTTEFGYVDGVTAGTSAASKALVTNSSNTLGSLGALAIGATVPTNPQAILAVLPQAVSATANQSYFHQQILTTGGAVTIPTGTAAVVASLNIHEPNITATGTVTAAATVRIVDAPTEGGSNYALWVDSGVTRFDGNLTFAAGAVTSTVIANTASAFGWTDGTTTYLNVDTRNTVKDVSTVTLTGIAPTITTEAAAHINSTLRLAAKTITYTGTTTTTSSLGAALHVGAVTFTDASMATLTTASAVHITALAAAGGMLTITNSRMISTSVSDAYLTNLGVWTDTACWAAGKEQIDRGFQHAKEAVGRVLNRIVPATWKYRAVAELPGIGDDGSETVHRTEINDRGRERVGIVYDDLPDELRAPGEERGVSTGVLSSFALAALKMLWDRNQELEARLLKLESA